MIKHLRKMFRIFHRNNSKKFTTKNVKKRTLVVQIEFIILKTLIRKK